ncbi:MAG: hypothetical protein K0S32_1808 [Bacteroidetes bacterium]|jgi:hypothetical protein|nr:hypothetical protein [Bacteroidota bacterium]
MILAAGMKYRFHIIKSTVKEGSPKRTLLPSGPNGWQLLWDMAGGDETTSLNPEINQSTIIFPFFKGAHLSKIV